MEKISRKGYRRNKMIYKKYNLKTSEKAQLEREAKLYN
jgi:hypothetical protein